MSFSNIYVNTCAELDKLHLKKVLNKKNTKTYPIYLSIYLFRDFLMFDEIFLSPELKIIVVITNEHGIYEWTHNLPTA